MISGFEEYTFELTEDEKHIIVPKLENIFKGRVGKSKAVKNKDICRNLLVIGIKTNGPRIRKMIHYLRVTGKVQLLMSNSKGYYIAESKDELKIHVKSLNERARSIKAVADSLELQADMTDFDNTQYTLL